MSSSRKNVKVSPVQASSKSPKNGAKRHCHVCRSPKDISKIVTCSSGKRSHIFCSSCVERRLQLTFSAVMTDPAWICPKCRDCCPCSKCRKREQNPSDLSSHSEISEDTDAALTLLDIKRSPIVTFTPSPDPPTFKHIPHRISTRHGSPSLAFSNLSIVSSPDTTSSVDHSPQLSPIALSPQQNPNTPSSPSLGPTAISTASTTIVSSRGSLNSFHNTRQRSGSDTTGGKPTAPSSDSTFARPQAITDRRSSANSPSLSGITHRSPGLSPTVQTTRSLLSSPILVPSQQLNLLDDARLKQQSNVTQQIVTPPMDQAKAAST